MLLRAACIAVITSAALMTSGCASLFGESQYPVAISSSPPGASYEITNEAGESVMSGVTPDQPTLKSSAGYFDGERYQVKFKKDGYNSESKTLDSGVDGWYWWNILLGGVIGMVIVDPITGAMYDLPEKSHASLELAQAQAQAGPVSPPKAPAVPTSAAKSKEQLLNELADDKSLSYEEYQRRYQIIMRQP